MFTIAAGLGDPPKVVDPISTTGIILFGLLLAIGLAVAFGGTLLLDSYDIASVGWIAMAVGSLMTYFASVRFFRAIHPESSTAFWLTLGALVALPIVAAAAMEGVGMAGRRWPAVAGTLLAVVFAWLADKFYEWLALIPMALGGLLAIGVFAWFVATND